MNFISVASSILTTYPVKSILQVSSFTSEQRRGMERLGDLPRVTPLSQDVNTDGLISEPEPLFYIFTPKTISQVMEGTISEM